jgi:hypoxanthine phosphoribosyltransferase
MNDVRTQLLSQAEVQAKVATLAKEIAPRIDDDTVCVVLLTGGLWFAADMTRELAKLDKHPTFDAMWVTSYGDAKKTSGDVVLRAGLQRSVDGKQVLILDDVLDSGLSLEAVTILAREAGAREVLTAVFARKPYDGVRPHTPDFVAWEAPDRFLVGYGLDAAGRYRGLPGIEALD